MVIIMDLFERMKKEIEDLAEKHVKEAKLLPNTLEAEIREIGEKYIETAKDIEAIHTLLDKDIILSRTYDLKELKYSVSVQVLSRDIRIDTPTSTFHIPYEEGMKLKIIIYKE